MLKTGLISVTFRKLSPEEIIKLAVRAGLHAIEWGGDIHVPPDDRKRAEMIGSWTRAAGIEVASYGSYYRVGCSNAGNGKIAEFEQVLETAKALQAPAIRVWAGDRGTLDANESWWSQVIEDTQRIAELAQKAELSVDFEFHRGTLTDSVDTTLRLLTSVERSNVRCHWQPQVHASKEQRLQGLQQLIPWLANLHVFHWLVEERCPLADGNEEWKRYIAEAAKIAKTGKNHYALLEFVKDDDPEQLLRDSVTLKSLLGV